MRSGMRHLVASELLPWLAVFPVIELTDESLAMMWAPMPGQWAITPPPLSP